MATTVNTNLNAGLSSIYEKLLEIGDILVLMLPSTKVQTGVGPDNNVVFFRVSRKNYFYAKIPIGNLAAGSTLDFDRLTLAGIEHTSGKEDIFSVANTNQFYIYHAAVCTDQNNATVRIGLENPAGYLINGLVPQTPPSESPHSNQDVFGWFRDDLAQNNNVATELTEQIYVYNNIPNFAIAVETSGTAITSGNMLCHGAGYQLQQITDKAIQDKILAGAYPSKTKMKTYGALLPFTATMPNDWSKPRALTATEFTSLVELIATTG